MQSGKGIESKTRKRFLFSRYHAACCPGRLDSRDFFPPRQMGRKKTLSRILERCTLGLFHLPEGRVCVSGDPAVSHFPDRTGLVSNGRWTDYWHPRSTETEMDWRHGVWWLGSCRGDGCYDASLLNLECMAFE